MNSKTILLFASIGLLATLTTEAQESEQLMDYRSRAERYNQDVQASEKNIRIGRELEQAARADYKPKLSAGANFNYTGNPMELTLDLPSLGQPMTFEGRDLKYGANLSLTQPVYTGGRIKETVRQAQKATSFAINQTEAIKSNIRYEADMRYWNTVARAEMTAIMDRFRLSVERLTDVVRARVEVKLVDRSDLLMAEVKLNEANYQRMQAVNNYEVARMTMNSFIGTPLSEETPTDSIIPPILFAGTLTEQLATAGANRAELRMAEDRIAIQQSALKLNDAKYLPQFYVGVDGSYGSPGYNFKSDLDPNYAVYAKISIPLFEWGKRRSEKRASALRVSIAKDNYSKVSDGVRLEVQSAYYSFTQATERVRLTANSLAKARENEAMAVEKYKEGKISIAEVLDAQIYHQTAQVNYVQSRLAAQMSHSEFIRAVGVNPAI
ncbi:MAG: TolC family protein [Tannerellaceae bacterium]